MPQRQIVGLLSNVPTRTGLQPFLPAIKYAWFLIKLNVVVLKNHKNLTFLNESSIGDVCFLYKPMVLK